MTMPVRERRKVDQEQQRYEGLRAVGACQEERLSGLERLNHARTELAAGLAKKESVGKTGAAWGYDADLETRRLAGLYLQNPAWNFPFNVYGRGLKLDFRPMRPYLGLANRGL
jgi:hypothetical protein